MLSIISFNHSEILQTRKSCWKLRRIIPHTLFMTEFNIYEGEMNEETKFPKVSVYSYAQILLMGKEETHINNTRILLLV